MKTTAFCRLPWKHIKVNCEGDMMMCCDQNYGTLGNILRSTFDEIWFGEVAEDIRDKTKQATLHPLCLNLYCPYTHRNLEDAMETFDHKSHPTSCEIDLPNTHCNVGFEKPSEKSPACIMCPRSSEDFVAEKDNLQQVCQKMSFLLPNLYTIHIQGIAEPFYKDKIFDVLDWLEYDKHIKENSHLVVGTITNGTLFKSSRQDRFTDRCHKTRICFSLDAATPETYRKIRILDAYQVVRKNMIEYGRKRDRNHHELQINNNLNTLNVHEVVGMVNDAAEAEVNSLQFTTTDPCVKKIANITVNENNFKLFQKAKHDAIQRGQQLGVNVTFRKPVQQDYGFDWGEIDSEKNMVLYHISF